MTAPLADLKQRHAVAGFRAPVVARLLRRTEMQGDCWVWHGALSRKGYGRIAVGGGRWQLTHRVSHELFKGPIPDGLTVDHLCRNRACLRPDHLEAVPGRDNTLRGIGWTARNAAKTHCPSGHPYDAENTYVWRGSRFCRACRVTGARTAGRPYRAGAA